MSSRLPEDEVRSAFEKELLALENEDSLFELCKEVYRRTEWHGPVSPGPRVNFYDGLLLVGEREPGIPLYTSDYLLEKLPRGNDLFDEPCILAVTQHSNEQWLASYLPYMNEDPMQPKSAEYADSPLKALLKLVLALDDAGVKL